MIRPIPGFDGYYANDLGQVVSYRLVGAIAKSLGVTCKTIAAISTKKRYTNL